MIKLFNDFNIILTKLQELKSTRKISDFRLSLMQNNSIDIVILSEGIIEIQELQKPNISLTFVDHLELEEDSFYKELFAGTKTFNISNSRRRFSNLLDISDSDNYIPPCPVVTFYSYKGGMGRSTSIAACASYLAMHHKKRVVIIDCDFEAPGFSNFFLEEPAYPKYSQGLVEYIFNKESTEETSINQYIWQVSAKFTDEGAIYIMPAGNLNDDDPIDEIFGTHKDHYLEGLARLDFASTEYIVKQFRDLIKNIHEEIKPDFIFIDSRTGFTDIFGLASIKLSSFIAGFFGNSVQNLPGLYFFIDIIRKINISKNNFTGILINSFSRPKSFREFKIIVEEYINKTTYELSGDLGTIDIDKYFFSTNSILERIGTTDEDTTEFIDSIKDKSIGTGYIDLFEKIKDFAENIYSANLVEKVVEDTHINSQNDKTNHIISNSNIDNQKELKKKIFTSLIENWPDMYAENIDYNTEFEKNRYFYRKCMQDLFNFDRFLVLGNKGTGKSYIYQSLKHNGIVNELKNKANKTNFNYIFFHLIDKTTKFMLQTTEFEGFTIEQPELFFKRFWLVYTWCAIMNIQKEKQLGYKTNLEILPIRTNDTDLIKKYYDLINNNEKIIEIEKDLIQLDSHLNKTQKYLMVIYDNLDEMVMPHKWYEQIAPLLNLWKYTSYNRIFPKLFVRRDLFNKISGVTNIKDLENKAIDIEWSKEEIFAYFFKLVLSKSKEDFFKIMELYKDFPSDTIKEIKKKAKSENQYATDEYLLRKLSETFFGKYAENPVHGESYDWPPHSKHPTKKTPYHHW
jgi:MinD-like ATPase involved in chromosome partitioning or flagellar assembly